MYIRNIYILIVIFIELCLPYGFLASTVNSDNILNRFNGLMDKIEYNLNNNNLDEACKNSNFALHLIEINLEELNKAQPNYSWSEISKLLKILPIQICSK